MMRLFVALDIDSEIRDRISKFVGRVRDLAPEVRWVSEQSWHVTLKFIGQQSEENAQRIAEALKCLKCSTFQIAFRGLGFFPNSKAARVLWAGIEAGPPLAQLAKSIDGCLAEFGIDNDEKIYNPHLTLARGGNKSGNPKRQKDDAPNSRFKRLQQELSSLPAPEFGNMTAREFFLYQSHLGAGGSRYERLARYELI